MNFLQIESANNKNKLFKGDVWRNLVMGSLLVAVIGIAIGSTVLSSTTFFLSIGDVAKKSFPFAEDVPSIKSGGDIVIDPVHVPKPPILTGELVDASTFSAEKVIVRDVASGALLYEKNAYEIWPLASITKLMSALVVLEKFPDWTTSTIVVSDNVSDTHMYAGDTYTLEDLWRAALIGSSNKAILTLADAVGWPRDAFIERMNQKALELGMNNTHFTDPSGLDNGNISTSFDVVLLLSEAISHEEIQKTLLLNEHLLYSKERKKQHHMWNTNWLLLGWITHGFADILGGKTGYIVSSGYNFTARVSDASGHQIDIVVLGASTHENRFTVLRDVGKWIYNNYTWEDEVVDNIRTETESVI